MTRNKFIMFFWVSNCSFPQIFLKLTYYTQTYNYCKHSNKNGSIRVNDSSLLGVSDYYIRVIWYFILALFQYCIHTIFALLYTLKIYNIAPIIAWLFSDTFHYLLFHNRCAPIYDVCVLFVHIPKGTTHTEGIMKHSRTLRSLTAGCQERRHCKAA